MADPNVPASPGPAGATWRAAAMLLCLIGLPLVALRGTAWNEVAKTVSEISRGILSGYLGESPALARESPVIPPERSQRDPRGAKSIWPDRQPAKEPSHSGAGIARSGPASRMDRHGCVPVSRRDQGAMNPPIPEKPDSGQGCVRPTEHGSSRSETGSREFPPFVAMAWHDGSRGGAADAPPLRDAVIRPEASEADVSIHFQHVLARLRELGAVHYMLETWGNDAQRFRFHCKMALNSNPNYIRHFEAIDRDPVRAMRQVLVEVEAWRKEH